MHLQQRFLLAEAGQQAAGSVRDHRRETESEVSATVLRRYKNAVSLALPSVMAWGAEEDAALRAAEPAARAELLRAIAFVGMQWLQRPASKRAELAAAAREALPPRTGERLPGCDLRHQQPPLDVVCSGRRSRAQRKRSHSG